MENIGCGQEDIFAPQLEKSVNRRSKSILKNRVDFKRFMSHPKGCDVSRLKNSKNFLEDVGEVIERWHPTEKWKKPYGKILNETRKLH